MKIPGRVGYQCANFYRLLIKNGDIVDQRYTVQSDGKIYYNFKAKKTGINENKTLRTENRKSRKRFSTKTTAKAPKRERKNITNGSNNTKSEEQNIVQLESNHPLIPFPMFSMPVQNKSNEYLNSAMNFDVCAGCCSTSSLPFSPVLISFTINSITII